MSIAEQLEKRFSLADKVVVLTGAVGGIGKVMAVELAKVGAKMALCDISEDKLILLKEEIIQSGACAEIFPFDITATDQIVRNVDAIADHFGKIDVLINCAGINKREGMLDVSEETYDKIMAINLKGTYFMSREVALKMLPQKQGSIINIASYNAVSMLGGCSVYGATKGGVAALTRSMAIEWAKHGIRANAISPGHILTELSKPNWTIPERKHFLEERIAMRRPGDPDELIGLTILLASDASSYMSGMLIHVDGGCLAGGSPWPYDTNY